MAAGMADERVAWGTLQLPSATPDYWRPRLEKPSGSMFVAEVDGQVAGTAGFHPYPAPSAHAAGLGMSVHAAWQGRGVAGPLMETVLAAAKAQGLERIDLEVYSDNERAIRLYRRFGFVKEGVKRYDVWRFGGHASSDVMGLRLG
jgi:putative acetyltransferase